MPAAPSRPLPVSGLVSGPVSRRRGRVLTALALGAALGLAACGPVDDDSRARSGAMVGAGVGAAAGALSGRGGSDRLRRAVIGAGVGAALGGATGAILDAQASELRRDLGPGVDVVNTGRELIVTLPQDLLFAVDSAVLRPDLQAELRVVADSLNRYPDSTIRVVGHTDNTGSAAHNQALSERRANSVAAVLRDGGVPGWRIQTLGRGLTQPVASNATPEGRRQNRRVEIFIVPTGT
jgi:outer membrane protein OmpA-like peptidoglycan-associated protein